MALSETRISEYSNSEYVGYVPENIKAMGELKDQDGTVLLRMAFTTKRDIITDIGVTTFDHCTEIMKAMSAVACEMARGKAVMALELIGPEDILKVLSDETEADDHEYYTALMVVMIIRNTLSRYASYRSTENNDR